MILKLVADKVSVRGPKVDGSFVINLELGEYQQKQWAELMMQLRLNETIEVTLEQADGEGYKDEA